MSDNKVFVNKKETLTKGKGFVFEEKPQETPESLPPKEIEKAREVIRREISKKSKEQETPLKPTPKPTQISAQPVPVVLEKSPELIHIENILEENLHETFRTMDSTNQMRFKQEGERVARKIEQILYQAKIKIKEILDLIRNWLKTIPGVNKFFIEQETKIKMDKIMALRNKG